MKKGKYSFWSNFRWYVSLVKKEQPILFVMIFLGVLLNLGNLFLTALLPTLIVNGVVQHLALKTVLLQVVGCGLALNICQYGENILWNIWGGTKKMHIRLKMMGDTVEKFSEVSYERLESPTYRSHFEGMAQQAFFSGSSSGMEAYLLRWYEILKNSLTLVVFVGTLTFFNPLLFLLVLIAGVISNLGYHFYNKHYILYKKNLLSLYMKARYLKNNAYKVENGKDVRLYNMTKWFDVVYQDNVDQQVVVETTRQNKYLFSQFFQQGATFLQNAGSYGILLGGIVKGTLSLSQFTLYFGFINQFSTLVINLVENIAKVKLADNDNLDLRKWLADSDENIQELQKVTYQLTKNDKITMRFEDVSFKYPESATYSVENVSFTIQAGEKIALVGANGAGKSTIVKLMARLLTPTSGKIYVNEVDIQTISYDAYLKLMAPVFQEALVLALTLGQNISLQETYDKARAEKALKESHLWEKVQGLEKGLETPLTTYLENDGVEFSGGEKQKLMLARALYKDAPFLILDEPTAALDAIAERELYEGYNQLAHGKTSVFVSHRLASTRFCDRIFYLEKAHLEEVGSHEELLACQGKYAKMYEVQSYYYQKEGQQHEKTVAEF